MMPTWMKMAETKRHHCPAKTKAPRSAPQRARLGELTPHTSRPRSWTERSRSAAKITKKNTKFAVNRANDTGMKLGTRFRSSFPSPPARYPMAALQSGQILALRSTSARQFGHIRVVDCEPRQRLRKESHCSSSCLSSLLSFHKNRCLFIIRLDPIGVSGNADVS